MQSRNVPYLAAVDHLRAFAAILLILYHGVQLLTRDICVVLVLPITIAISFLTYHVIERPFLELRVRYLVDRPKEAASTDAADGSGREQTRSVAA
jgi:peptidoglycan/LPS O-acetylase OafA/YrhL